MIIYFISKIKQLLCCIVDFKCSTMILTKFYKIYYYMLLFTYKSTFKYHKPSKDAIYMSCLNFIKFHNL